MSKRKKAAKATANKFANNAGKKYYKIRKKFLILQQAALNNWVHGLAEWDEVLQIERRLS